MKEILPALSAESAVPPRVASGSDECRESSETGIQSSCVRKAEILLTELLKQHDAGENPDWELLRGLPGMRLEPMPWNEAVEVVRDGTSVALARLGRMPLQSKHYREFRDGVILQEYVSVTDYLYATVFGLDCKQNSRRHGKLQAIVPDEFHAGEPVIVWRRNVSVAGYAFTHTQMYMFSTSHQGIRR